MKTQPTIRHKNSAHLKNRLMMTFPTAERSRVRM